MRMDIVYGMPLPVVMLLRPPTFVPGDEEVEEEAVHEGVVTVP